MGIKKMPDAALLRKLLGFFNNFDEAVAARRKSERKYGFHPNHGRAS